jgi:hypothetical protein
MERVSVDDVRKSMRFLTLALAEERIPIVAAFLNQVLEALQPLGKLNLPKELEPTSYLVRLREAGRANSSEDV